MSDHIQIGDVSPRVQYVADGAQTQFTYPFPIFVAADIEVYLGEAKQVSGYTVAGAGQSAGGSVTFAAAPADGVVVTLRRRLAIRRTSDFQESGEFRAKVINDELDYQTAALQQVADDGDRAVRLAPTDAAADMTLPAKTDRAGKYLACDGDGKIIASAAPSGGVPVSAFVQALLDDPDAATVRANLGLGTAAVLNSGTSANNVVQLDGSGKLPAVDGSQLTNMSAADPEARNVNIEQAWDLAELKAVTAIAAAGLFVDVFSAETYVDTATSANETYDGTNKLYHNPGAHSLETGTLTAPGTGISPTNLSNAADDNSGTTGSLYFNNNWTGEPVANRRIFSWDFGSNKNITRIKATNITLSAGGANCEPYYSTDGTTWAVVPEGSGNGISLSTSTASKTWDIAPLTARYIALVGPAVGWAGITLTFADFVCYSGGTPLSMTLQSNAITAASAPGKLFLAFDIEEGSTGAIVANTDFVGKITADGSTWATVTLAQIAQASSTRKSWGGQVTAGFGTGTAVKWKLECTTGEHVKCHGVAVAADKTLSV